MNSSSFPKLLLLAALCLAQAGCDEGEAVVVVQSEKEANRVLVALEQRGIASPTKSQQTQNRQTVWEVRVAPNQASRARQILVQLDLPREQRGGLESMLNNTGLIPSRTDERARLMHAIAGELEQTLETYDRVVRARVHVVIPEEEMALSKDPEAKKNPSATVLIKYVASQQADPQAEPAGEDASDAPLAEDQVKGIVANSVEGLAPESVFVAMTRAESLPPVQPGAATTPGATGAPGDATGEKDPLVSQMFIAVAVFGVILIALVFMLMKKNKRSAAQARPA